MLLTIVVSTALLAGLPEWASAASAGTPTVSVNNGAVYCGNTTGSAVLRLETFLSAASTKVVTVGYATKDHTAISPTNYTAASGTVTFNPGVTSQYISVTVFCPPPTTTSVYFDVNLSQAMNASIYVGLAYGSIYAGTAPKVCPAHTQCG